MTVYTLLLFVILGATGPQISAAPRPTWGHRHPCYCIGNPPAHNTQP